MIVSYCLLRKKLYLSYKMRYLSIILIFSFCIIGCQKCKKDTPVPKQYSNAGAPNQSMLDYGVFKPGTYWVYQDSTSGRLDSVWVYEYEETADTIYKDTDHPKICKVYLYQTFSSRYRSNNHFQYNSAFEYNNNLSMLIEDVVDSTGSIGEYVNFFMPFVVNKDVSYITDDNCKAISNSVSLTLNSITYTNCLVYSHTKDASTYYFSNYLPYKNKTNKYMASHIGLIRKEIPDSNRVWNLIRYHIVQ